MGAHLEHFGSIANLDVRVGSQVIYPHGIFPLPPHGPDQQVTAADRAQGTCHFLRPFTFRRDNQAKWQFTRYREEYVKVNGESPTYAESGIRLVVAKFVSVAISRRGECAISAIFRMSAAMTSRLCGPL